MVRKVRAGHLTDGRHAPCIFSFPPCIPPRGNSRPPAPQNKVCRDRARAFLCSSPVTVPAFFRFRDQARASPAISSAPWTGTAFASLRAAFYSHRHPRPPPQEEQGPRQPLTGLSCPLLRYANAAPVFRAVTSFALFFCFRARLAADSRVWAMPHPRV